MERPIWPYPVATCPRPPFRPSHRWVRSCRQVGASYAPLPLGIRLIPPRPGRSAVAEAAVCA